MQFRMTWSFSSVGKPFQLKVSLISISSVDSLWWCEDGALYRVYIWPVVSKRNYKVEGPGKRKLQTRKNFCLLIGIIPHFKVKYD